MPAITRKGDTCTGHGSFPPRPSTTGSGSVFINGIPVHRQGDAWAVHCNSQPVCHGGSLASGSSSVYADGKQIGRIGDPVNCGSSVATGSPDVFAGG
ncbi:PAAR domain-containing protein [Halomonas sp. V046]|uniref:PAAR domain-containing protein n=1 Tax=Halomonas sp. V046 TaxID=3459611 RepID=UPI00404444E5